MVQSLRYTSKKQPPAKKLQPETKPRKLLKKDQETKKFKCGDRRCNRVYLSYTAFYNHCKKSHDGEFPRKSMVNGKAFVGPSNRRGRPRIAKNEVKKPQEIEVMKNTFALIEFLGTIDADKQREREEIIVYVHDPAQHINKTLQIVESWGWQDSEWLKQIKRINEAISVYDLPEFYDPIQQDNFPEKLDTYNFLSIMKFLQNTDNRTKCNIEEVNAELIQILTVLWLSRHLSINLLSEVIYTLGQHKQKKDKIIEKDYLVGKSQKFLEIIGDFLKCYDGDLNKEPELS